MPSELAAPKYASFERERRWLVNRQTRPQLVESDCILIEDRYLDGTRFRLRRMSKPGWVSCKLTKKYEAPDPAVRPIVTAYLSDAEYAVLGALAGRTIVKHRHRIPLGDQAWSLDLFEGRLAGLELIECEAADDVGLARLEPPAWVGREVTHDARYQGGSLARTLTIPEE